MENTPVASQQCLGHLNLLASALCAGKTPFLASTEVGRSEDCVNEKMRRGVSTGCLAAKALAFTLLTFKMELAESFAVLPLDSNRRFSIHLKGRNHARIGTPRYQTSAVCHHGHELLVNVGSSLPEAWFKTLGVPSADPVLQTLFLASNLAYLVAAAQTIRHRSSPKHRAAVALSLVSVVSFTFHRHQCVLGVG